jgi:hypothetical protein
MHKVILLFLVSIVTSALSFGQTSSVVGTVKDSSGAVIPSAKISILDSERGYQLTISTNDAGQFSFPTLPIGTYTLTVSHVGFQDAVVKSIQLDINHVARLDVELHVAAQSTSVSVNAEPSTLDTQTSELGQVISNKSIEYLPVNGRDFTKLSLLVPGAQSNVEGNLSGGIVVNGQRSTSNQYVIDGTDTTVGGGPFAYRTPGSGTPSGAVGTSSSLATMESIQEFKVQTANYSAEYGLVSGGIVNIVTKSGTNSLHGAVYDYLRDSKLDANDFFLNRAKIKKPPFTYNDIGGAIGGPILKDKTFFFATYDHQQEVFSRAVNGSTLGLGARASTDPALAPLLSFFPVPTGPDDPGGLTGPFVGVAPSKGRENDFSVRMDQQIGSADRLFGRYTYGDSSALIGGEFGSFPLSFQTTLARIQTVSISEVHTFSPTLYNTFTAGFSRNAADIFAELKPGPGTAGDPFGPDGQPVIAQVAILPVTLRGGSSPAQISHINDFSYREQLAWVTGRHTFKFGADIRRVQDNLLNYANHAGLYLFLTVPDFTKNRPFFFVDFTGNLHEGVRFTNFAPYVQDDWRVTSKLTLNLGLRYELNTVPTEAHGRLRNITQITDISTATLGAFGADLYKGDHNNFAPRIGFAYSPKQSMVVRGGIGIFYDTPTQLAGDLFFNPGITAINVIFGPPLGGPAKYPINPALLVSQPSPNPPFTQSVVIDPNLRNAYTIAYNLNVQHDLGQRTILKLAYVGNQGKKLYRQRALNLLQGGSTTPPNSNFPIGGITLVDNSAGSNYNAFQSGLTRQVGRLQGTFSYTLAHSIDDVSTTGGYGSVNSNIFPTNPNNLRADRGNSDFDLRHNVVLSFAYDLPVDKVSSLPHILSRGWSVGALYSYRTAFPYTPLLGSATVANGDPNLGGGERPDLVPGVPLYTVAGGFSHVANPAAFQCPGGGSIAAGCPTNGIFGNAGRNILRAFSFNQLDFDIAKDFLFTERYRLEFRADFFNLFNKTNFANPGTTNTNVLTSPQFGQPTSLANFSSTGLGQFFNSGGPRNIQMALRLRF